MGEFFSFLIVIGIIILVHETGHFSMAKFFGIPVATFSLGFGPKLFGFRFKETEYKVSLVPLGGYVKIHGMEDQQAAPDDPNSFYNRPWYQRFLVLFMGVGFNMILAIILITTVLTVGREVGKSTGLESRIGIIRPDSPAEKAGLKPGDVILEINDRKISNWQEVYYSVLLNPDEDVVVRLKRGNEVLLRKVHIERERVNSLGYIGIAPAMDVVVAALIKEMPAEKAGLREGDLIKFVNGKPIHDPATVALTIQESNGKPVEIVVERNEAGQKVTKAFKVQPVKYQQRGFWDRVFESVQKLFGKEPPKSEGPWFIGFVPDEPSVIKKLSFPQALAESIRTCKEHVQLNAIFIGKLIQGKLSLRATSGPFQIAGLSQAARKSGWTTFLLFIGLLSFDIGLINLLPIPALDGGHIFFLIIEGIFRRELSVKLKERMTVVGFVFLICLMVVVLYYDISKTGPVQRLIDSLGSR